MHQHQQATDYGKECGNFKFLLLRVTLLFCYSVLPSWQGMRQPKTEVLILSFDNLDICSCLYLSRAEVETLSTQNGSAWVSWWFMSSGDTLLPSFLPFPGEDTLAEWKCCSCVPLIWHRKGNCFTSLCEGIGLVICLLLPFYSAQFVLPVWLMRRKSGPERLDHSAVNNPVTKEKADD